jgi:hypothetical protein
MSRIITLYRRVLQRAAAIRNHNCCNIAITLKIPHRIPVSEIVGLLLDELGGLLAGTGYVIRYACGLLSGGGGIVGASGMLEGVCQE